MQSGKGNGICMKGISEKEFGPKYVTTQKSRDSVVAGHLGRVL